MEPDIDYDTLIQVMDRVRATELPDGTEVLMKVKIFSE